LNDPQSQLRSIQLENQLSTEISRFIAIDEEGYFKFDERRLEDEKVGRETLEKIERVDGDRFTTEMEGQTAWVEAFDEPFVARHVRREGQKWFLDLPYGLVRAFDPKILTLDEWDRFHGYVEGQIPFVFSRSAQFEFFNLLDGYDDTSIEVDGESRELPPWLGQTPEVNGPQFWTNIYKSQTPQWELEMPAPALGAVLPQIKLPKSRVLVLCSGSGEDAAHFAKQGHVVTAVDFSDEALSRAAKKFGDLPINWVKSDIFALPEKLSGQFDLVFEHTCYCAINPDRRNDLVKVWRKVLTARGQLLGIFFVHDKPAGPPFGGSEWEVRKRLQGKFHSLYWTRWHHSVEPRQSQELVVFANKM
jgi:SAM-dependent methyltransferase